MTEIVLMVIAMTTIATAAQVCLKRGIDMLGGVNSAFEIIRAALANGWVMTGLVLYAASATVWIFVLHQADLSIAAPISGAAYYLVTTVVAVVFLGEAVSPRVAVAVVLLVTADYLLVAR